MLEMRDAPEQQRNQGDVYLVDQPGGKVLLCGARPTGEYDVFAASGPHGLIERRLNVVGHERECRAALTVGGDGESVRRRRAGLRRVRASLSPVHRAAPVGG